jgi:hypothetical protein
MPAKKINRPVVNWLRKARGWLWPASIWRRVLTVLIAVVLGFTVLSYGVAEWYIHKHNQEPLVLGTSFISDYAQSFGLDPKQTLNAIFQDLGIRQVRLVSYWNQVEKTPGHYDFSDLDWQFAMANKYGAKVSLAIGLRQPRWPECHEPSFIDTTKPESQWTPQLNKYMLAVIERYKNNPALQDYELENEFFMTVFGECKNFDRNRLVNEFNMVKAADPKHHVIISRSDNWIGIPVGQPKPDEFAISVYKRVWDSTITHRYFEYPLPPWFYASLAGWEELLSGRSMIIHELQTEPWTPKGQNIIQTSVEEQFKSINPERLENRIQYGKDTGMRTIDLWGAEWWYWMKVDKHNDSIWSTVKQAVAQAQIENQKLAAKKSPY